MVVKVEICAQSMPESMSVSVILEVEILVFQGAPQAFDEDIVEATAFSPPSALNI